MKDKNQSNHYVTNEERINFMKIMELNLSELERLRECMELSKIKEKLDFSTFKKLNKSIDENSTKISSAANSKFNLFIGD